MSIFEAIILGIVQGLTEFLPVSSSAHLRIMTEALGIGDAGSAFTAITQIGTEAAVILFFWHDIVRIIGNWFKSLAGKIPRNDPDAKMGWWIILGSLPIVVLGLLFEDAIDSTLRSLWFVAISLIVFGILLGIADRIGKRKRELKNLTPTHGVIYGFAQAAALIPGVSRSGGTITAGLLMGYTREEAARYSFLLAIPAVLGSGGYKLVKAVGEPGTTPALATTVATVVAFFVAIIVIKLFMSYISHGSFMPFVIYRIILGIVIIVLVGTGVLTAESSMTAASTIPIGGNQ
ncbi:MAG: undecaprenyl-diphosphate phosphatase [Canibacter sp.]